ncbi:type I secretion system permease/ATPase [Palleronia abyssalis]|uniref:Type I secretion system ATP-binding protein PrsD n=1 Tax=Palleronia abyssalis TaxID=1501240 RepID=A0A2R8C0N2_9RHOB|nr:type I secretion system permease/ATPase [Palleronia abyssalis]SPJ25977.1 Type I secretion system ATP-binding protein PrsD [Palleronia abyssalis]
MSGEAEGPRPPFEPGLLRRPEVARMIDNMRAADLLGILPGRNPSRAGPVVTDPAPGGTPAARATSASAPGEPALQRRQADEDFRAALGRSMAAFRTNIVTVVIFSFVANALLLAVPIYLFQVSDRVLSSRSLDTLAMLTMIIVGLLFVHSLIDVARRIVLMRTAAQVESRLGAPVLSAAARASQNGSSMEFQRLGDLQQIRGFITGSTLMTLCDLPVAPLYLGVLFLIHPHFGYIVTVTALVLALIAWLTKRFTAVPFAKANMHAARANLQADALARNAQVINAMGMTPEGVVLWGRETAASLKAQILAQDRNVLAAGVSKFVRLMTQITVLGWGAYLALQGGLSAGMIIAASIIGARALGPIEGAIEGWKNVVSARSAYDRIRLLLQNSPLNVARLELPRPTGLLTVERVLYVPPPQKKVILNGISFELEPGESLAIVGSSGAGKSTLARMLVGSVMPTAGAVRLDRMDLRNWNMRQFGASIGYLPQDVQLFPGTVKANIARMRGDATDEAIFDAAEIADVHGLISQLPSGYETFVSMDGAPLSGGQKQRIGLARAFFGDPRLVVLDEPNSNLDTAGEQALAASLARAKAREITVVAVTQRPALLKNVDKILVLEGGSVKMMGPQSEVLPILRGGALPPAAMAPQLQGGGDQ